MKKVWFIIFAILLIAVSTSEAWNDGWSSGGVETSTECNASKYYKDGTLCQDTDDNKLYLGTGSAVQEIVNATEIGTIATQAADSVNIDGGAIDGTAIGANSASTGAFTTLQAATTKFTTGAGAGYILVSDADRDGTWTAGTTDASSNSTAIYKASDGSIASWTTTIDGHANATLTLYPGICPIVHNTSQADANVTITLPTVASGLCFTALVVTTEDDKTWRFNSAEANTICLGATCAKDDIGFATGQNTKGGLFKCIAQGTEWFCHTITGTVDAGDL